MRVSLAKEFVFIPNLARFVCSLELFPTRWRSLIQLNHHQLRRLGEIEPEKSGYMGTGTSFMPFLSDASKTVGNYYNVTQMLNTYIRGKKEKKKEEKF